VEEERQGWEAWLTNEQQREAFESVQMSRREEFESVQRSRREALERSERERMIEALAAARDYEILQRWGTSMQVDSLGP
jgi:hypothetical protein